MVHYHINKLDFNMNLTSHIDITNSSLNKLIPTPWTNSQVMKMVNLVFMNEKAVMVSQMNQKVANFSPKYKVNILSESAGLL